MPVAPDPIQAGETWVSEPGNAPENTGEGGLAKLAKSVRGSSAIFVSVILLSFMLLPAAGREREWTFSPLPGEGDRAAMGCTTAATPADFGCLVVRCEPDYSVGLYIDTSLDDLSVGPWSIGIDKEERKFDAKPARAPYGARLVGDTDWLFDGIKHGAVAYLQPEFQSIPNSSLVDLTGSYQAVTLALAYCAPRVPAQDPLPERPLP